jgi:hypothetical protein
LTNLNLDFKRNQIGDEGAKKLSECLSKLTNLTTLNLNIGNNGISRQGSIFIGNNLSQFLKFPVFRLSKE